MLKYFIEIENRLILVALSSLHTSIIIYYYKETIICVIIHSCTLFLSSKNLSTLHFIFTDVSEIFLVYSEMIFFLCAQTTLVFFCYHVLMFLNWAFFKNEYTFFKFIFKLLFFTWIISFFIASNLIIPLAFFFFLKFQDLMVLNSSFKLHFEARIIHYFDFYVYFSCLCIFYFQFISLLFLAFKLIDYDLEQATLIRSFHYSFFIACAILLDLNTVIEFLLFILFIFKYEFFVFYFIFKKLLKENLI